MWRPTTASLAKAEDGASARSRVPRLHIGEAGMQATLSLSLCVFIVSEFDIHVHT
jgi:hypothetical protein